MYKSYSMELAGRTLTCLLYTSPEQKKRIWRTGSGHGVCFRQTDDPYFRRTSYTSGKNGRGHTAVSYTHLDVYKRQAVESEETETEETEEVSEETTVEE